MNFELDDLSADTLAERCREESSSKREDRDDRYCYELVRRAFGDDQYALGRVLDIYLTVWSSYWVKDASKFVDAPLTIDDFKSDAFTNCYRLIKSANNGAGKFADFETTYAFRKYLKRSFFRAIAAYQRSQKTKPSPVRMTAADEEEDLLDILPADENTSAEAEHNVGWELVERRVYALLPKNSDRVLFDYWAKGGMSYAEIAALFGPSLPTENAVRVALQRIRRCLCRDEVLRKLLKGLL